jgi:hypothetical protein
MITISKDTFELLCRRVGKSLEEAMPSVVSSSDRFFVVDDKHESYPVPKRPRRCCGADAEVNDG